jgi:pimeloyl-ACP methyl ester carboxylesterase
MERIAYDEFSFFHENLAEWGLDVAVPPVARTRFAVDATRSISALQWGNSAPEFLFIHGGAQNAHTFDTVALALQRPLLAVDLPGHGHSDPSPYGLAAASAHARDLEAVLDAFPDTTFVLVGMSLGGLTALQLAAARPERFSQLVLVDITPGVNGTKAKHIHEFVNGPKTFERFDELLERTMAFNPTRSESSLRRGILHNALQLEDGTWVWRHQQHGPATLEGPNPGDLWETLAQLPLPLTLLRGMAKGSVVDDDDVAQINRLHPEATVIEITNAGHSIQGDAPLVMADILRSM